jgi:hypothetical protein
MVLMAPSSRRTLLWCSLILLLVAGMIGAPEAGVAVAVLAALCAVPALRAGTRGLRLAALVLLLASAALALALLPAARRGMDGWRGRALTAPSRAAPR